jgi:aryl-alcohol dehydrogenase-like predicted oxidoreductase
MAMSGMYGASDERESTATIHAALDAGITLLDTGDFYGMGNNELLIGKSLQGRKRERAFIQVKFGAQRDPRGAWLGYDARPAAVKTALAYSLNRLGVEYVDLYQPSRLDPNVPIEETIGAIKDLVDAGYVRYIGVSEVGVETIRRANAVHPVAALQIEYSLMSRSVEAEILPALDAMGISVTAYGILSRGLLAGKTTDTMGMGDIRAHMPRWEGDNQRRNMETVRLLKAIADELGATTSQVALAWVRSRGDAIIPLVGARTCSQLAEALAALDLSFGREDFARIEAAVRPENVAGSRYAEQQMAVLDSER